MRWDSLFLEPINSAAKKAYELFHAHSWGKQDIISTRLTKPGDTLIIDNWRMLHGRSSVPKISMDRNIQRIYLNNIGKPEHA